MSKNTNLSFLTDYITADITNGRIGINNASPTVAFDVVGVAKFSSTLTAGAQVGITTTSTTAALQINLPSNANATILQAGANTSYGWKIQQEEITTGDFRIFRREVNVDYQVLNLARSTGAATFSSSVTAGDIFSTDGTRTNFFGVGTGANVGYVGTTTNHALAFLTNNTERMRITSGGIVMVNRTATGGQAGKVQVSSNGTDGYFVEQTAAGGYCLSNIAINNGGTYYFTYFGLTSGFSPGQITSNGSTMTYGGASDYRVKEDLKEINGLEKVSAIKIYNFKYKNSKNRMDGVLAHELQQVLPYAVTGIKDEVNSDGTPKIQNVDYSKIVPILIKSIQELKVEIDTLKNK